MDLSDATDLELQMLGKGYASSRMVSAKTKQHFATVLRLHKQGVIRGVSVGTQKFLEIASVREHYGPEVSELLELGDWGDVAAELRARSGS